MHSNYNKQASLSLHNLVLVLQGTKSATELKETLTRTGEIDNQSNGKKRRLTIEQVNQLEKSFEEENKLEPERKIKLSKTLGLSQRQVAVWFQNRKARCKIKNIEKDYDLLKACYDSLLAKHELVISENEILKSKVLALTEKLNQTQRSYQDKLYISHGSETMSSSQALVPLPNEDFSMFLHNQSPFSWWIPPSNLMQNI